MNLIDSAIADFYKQSNEDTRLQIGLGPLEFTRNKILIAKYITGKHLDIVDIGGGTGHYSNWLAILGHNVSLVDPVPGHIEKAKRKRGKFNCILGEARSLPFENSSFDLVILHGPLYHLQDQGDRLLAIREARRIIRPGGIVLGFAITHAASTLAALHTGMIHDPRVFQMCRLELLSGEHNPPGGMKGMLSYAHFHDPLGLQEEFTGSGFTVNGLHAVEGMAWMDNHFFQSWNDPQRKNNLLDLVNLTDQDRSLLCISPHMMISTSPNI